MHPVLLLNTLYSIFFIALGIILYYAGNRLPNIESYKTYRLLLFGFSIIHVAFGVLGVYGLLILAQTYGLSSCATVPNSTVLTGSTTTFTWTNTCSSTIVPEIFGTYIRIMSVIIKLEFMIVLVFIPIMLFTRLVRRKIS